MNEGPYSWTLGLWADIYPRFFWPSLEQIIPCTGLSPHAVFSDKARLGGPGQHAVFWGLIIPSRLREAFRDGAPDRSLLGLYRLCVYCPAAERHWQYRFLVDCPPPSPRLIELTVRGERRWGEKSIHWKERWYRYRESNILEFVVVFQFNAPFTFSFTVLFIHRCYLSESICAISSSFSVAKYWSVLTYLTWPFIWLSSLSWPQPHQSHWHVGRWVFRSTKQWQASSVWLSALALTICRSHTVHWLPIMMSWRREAERERWGGDCCYSVWADNGEYMSCAIMYLTVCR